MSNLFTIVFYQPIFNLLVSLYNIMPGHDIGLAIIALTVIIKILLLPLSKKAIESQKELQDLQPKVEELKKKYAGKKEEMGREMLKLYQEHKVNPFSSCLPILVQLPFFIAIYKSFSAGLANKSMDLLYPFVYHPEHLNVISMGFLDLSKPNWILAVLAGLAQYWQAKMMITKRPPVIGQGSKDEDMAAMMNKQMLYMMPALTVFIGISLPSGLSLYWLVTTILTALQQKFIFSKILKKKEDSPAVPQVIEGEVVEKK
jgi:YidC/Oxa1 family membrane protein insertase